MKLSFKFLTLLAANSVFAYTIPLNKRYENDMGVANSDVSVSEECNDAISKLDGFQDCIVRGINFLGKLDCEKNCSILTSEKCKNFYQTDFKEIPECKNEDESALISLKQLYKLIFLDSKSFCLTNESGNYCLFVDSDEDISYKPSREQFRQSICQSKKCTEDMLKVSDEILAFYDEMQSYNSISNNSGYMEDWQIRRSSKSIYRAIDFFNSDTCKSQARVTPAGANPTGNTQTGNAQADNTQAGNAQTGNAQAGANQVVTTQPETTQDSNNLALNNSTINNQTASNNSTNTTNSAAVSEYKLSYTLVTALVLIAFNILL